MSTFLSRCYHQAMRIAFFVLLFLAQGSAQDCPNKTIELQATNAQQYIAFPSELAVNCGHEWRLSGMNGTVKLFLLHLDIVESDNCEKGALTIYDGRDNSSKQLAKMCGLAIYQNRTFTSTSNNFFLSFQPHVYDVGTAFRIAFTSEQGTFCQGEVVELTATADNQFLTYSSYPSNCQRNWRITSSSNLVRLYILNMDIEMSQNCQSNSLAFYDGPNADGRQLAKLCQSSDSHNRDFTSTSTELFLSFHSDRNITGKGFRIVFTSDLGNPVPGKVVVKELIATRASEEVYFPPKLDNYYPNNADMQWRISSSNFSYDLRFELELVDIEGETNCRADSLTLYDGFDSNATELVSYCNRYRRKYIIRSKSNVFFLRFTSDMSVRRTGFLFKYSLEVPTCTSDSPPLIPLTAFHHDSYLISPNFPAKYPPDTAIHWLISSESESDPVTFDIKFVDIEMEGRATCINDSLTFFNGKDAQANYLGILCGTTKFNVPTLTSTSSQVYVCFRSLSQKQGQGFRIAFRAGGTNNGAALAGATVGGILRFNLIVFTIYTAL